MKKYGAKQFCTKNEALSADNNKVYYSNLWPRKTWFENEVTTDNFVWLSSLPDNATLPVSPVSEAGQSIKPSE